MVKKLLAIAFLLSVMAMNADKKIKIIFFGDSITQMGTDKGGYIDLLKDTLEIKGTSSQYEIMCSGVGYNKVYDLYL